MGVLFDIIKTNPLKYFQNENIRKNILNSFYYFGGNLLSFIIEIFTQPIFSRYLELEDFAIIGYFTAIQAILFPLFSMTLPFYYMAQYWKNDVGYQGHDNLSFINEL